MSQGSRETVQTETVGRRDREKERHKGRETDRKRGRETLRQRQ